DVPLAHPATTTLTTASGNARFTWRLYPKVVGPVMQNVMIVAVRLLAIVLALLVQTSHAFAEPVTLRFASVAPEGSAWARVFWSASRDAETLSHGDLKLRWVLGGIGGNEIMVAERMRRGQLDGEAAGISCANMMPSLRVLRVAGMVRRREEAHAIVNQLR